MASSNNPSSSLAQQLQTYQNEKSRGKGRTSFLFHSRDAMDYDIPTIYGIGLAGFTELLQRDPVAFSPFTENIFHENWMDIDRELRNTDYNNDINRLIHRLCYALIPYISLRASHKCIEWLIRRYKAHVYNVDALMSMILPHSDTAIFSRLIQIIEITNSTSTTQGNGSVSLPLWQFLHSNVTTGTPLPRSVLAKQCLKDPGVLKFICESTLEAVTLEYQAITQLSQQYKQSHSNGTEDIDNHNNFSPCSASTVLTWYTLTITEALTLIPANHNSLESMFSLLLPYIGKGLKDTTIPQYRTATYTITITLLSKLVITQKVFTAIIQSSIQGILHSRETEPNQHFLTFLIAIFTSQGYFQGINSTSSISSLSSSFSLASGSQWLNSFQFPSRSINTLLHIPQFITILSEIAQQHDINIFLKCFLTSSILHILQVPGDAKEIRTLLTKLPSGTAVEPLVPILVRFILSRYTAIRHGTLNLRTDFSFVSNNPDTDDTTLNDRVTLPDEGAAIDALATLLRYFGQSFGTATDNGIKMLMNSRRKRSSSVTMEIDDFSTTTTTTTMVPSSSTSPSSSPTNTLSRVGLDSDATESVNWASTILAGTDLTTISLTGTTMDIDASVALSSSSESSIASLRYALSHASVVVRERAMNHIHQEAEKLIKSVSILTNRSSSSSSSSSSSGKTPISVSDTQLSTVSIPLQTITHALDRALQDDEARIVLAALRTHTLLVAQGVLAVPVSLEDKSVHLLTTVLNIYYQWFPKITTIVNRSEDNVVSNKTKNTEVNRILMEILIFIGDNLLPLLQNTVTEEVSSIAVRSVGRAFFCILPVSSEKLTMVTKVTPQTVVTEPSFSDVRLTAFLYAQKLKFSFFSRLSSVPYPTVTDSTTTLDLSNHFALLLVESLQRSPSSSIVGLPSHGLVLLKEIMEMVQPSTGPVFTLETGLRSSSSVILGTVPLRAKWHALVILDTTITLIQASITDPSKNSTKSSSLLALKECVDQLAPVLRQEWLQLCTASATFTIAKRAKQSTNTNIQGLTINVSNSTNNSYVKYVFDDSIDKEPFFDMSGLTKLVQQGNDNAYHTLAGMHSRLRAQATFLIQAFSHICQSIVTILQNDTNGTTNVDLASYDCLNTLFNPSKISDNVPSSGNSNSYVGNDYSALIIRILLLFLSTPTEAITWESIASCSLPILKYCGDMSGASRIASITTTNEILSSPLRTLVTLATMSTATYESRKKLEIGLGNSLNSSTNDTIIDTSWSLSMDSLYRKIDHIVPLPVATRALELARVYFSSTSGQWSSTASASSTLIYHTLVHCILPFLYVCCFDNRTDESATVFRGHAISLMNEIAYYVNQGLQENSKNNKVGGNSNSTATSLQSVLSNNITSMYGSPTNDSTVTSLLSTHSNQSNTITLLLLAKSLVSAADVVVMDGTLARKIFMDTVKDVEDTVIPLLLSHAMISNTARTDITAFWLQMIKSSIYKDESGGNNHSSSSTSGTDPALILSLWPILQHILVNGIEVIVNSSSMGNGVSCNWGMYSSIVTTLEMVLRMPYRINHSLHNGNDMVTDTPTKSKGNNSKRDESITNMMMIAPAIVRLLIRIFGISANLHLYPTGYAATQTHANFPNSLKFVETTSFMEKSNQAISSSDIPSAGIQLVQAAIACITPVFWQFVCYDANNSSLSSKSNTNSPSSSTVDLLFEALVAVVAKGAPQAASMARHTLGRVRIPGIIVVRYMRKHGLCCDTLPSSATAVNSNTFTGLDLGPVFRYRNNVTVMLTSYASSIVQAMAWVRRLTVLVEVLVTAQNNGNPSNTSVVTNVSASHVLGQPILLPSLFSSLEMIIALSHLLPSLRLNGTGNLFGNSSATSTNPSSSPTSVALNSKVWEDEDVDSSIEYVKQLVSTAAHFATCTLPSANEMNGTSSSTKNDGTITTAISSLDAQIPIHIIHTCNSTQTRSATLLLLSSMATIIPDTVLQQLMPVFWMVGSAALARDDAFSFHTMQRLVEAIVPSLRIYGPAVGVPIPALLKVFAICIHRIPLHRQKPLYSSLLMTAAGGSSGTDSSLSLVPVANSTETGSTTVDKARYLPAMTALLLVQHVLSREKVTNNSTSSSSLLGGANTVDASTMINLDSILPMMQDHQSVTSKGSGSNTDTAEDASSLGPIPDVCASLLHRYSPQQQVKCLYTLLALAVKLMESPSVVSSPSKLQHSINNNSTDSSNNDNPINTNEIQQLWPYLLTTGIPNTTISTNLTENIGTGSSSPVPDNLPLTPAQRCAIGLVFIRFVSAHMSSKEFMGPALNVTTVASTKLMKSLTNVGAVSTSTIPAAAGDRMAKACLLLSERVFDVLQLASVSWRTAEAARLSQLQRLQGIEGNTVNDTATSLSGNKTILASTTGSGSRRDVQEAKRAVASLSSLQRFWNSVEDITYTVLDRLSMLLPPAAFVAVVSSLLQHSNSSVRRRSLLFLSDYLRSSYGEPLAIDTGNSTSSIPSTGTNDHKNIDETEILLFLQLIPDLLTLIKTDNNETMNDRVQDFNENRSTAIETITLLAAHFAKGHVSMFKEGIQTIVTLINAPVINDSGKKSLPLEIRATAFLSLAKLCFYVGPIAVPHLPVFIPKLLEAIEWTLKSNSTDTNSVGALLLSNKSTISISPSSVIALRKSIVLAIQYLFNTFATFLSPFLPRILRSLLHPIILGPLPLPSSHVRYDKRITIDAQGVPTIRSPGLDGKFTNTLSVSKGKSKGTTKDKSTPTTNVPIVQYEPKAKLPYFLTKEIKMATNLYTTVKATTNTINQPNAPTDPTVFEYDDELYTLSQTILSSLPQKIESRILLPVLLDLYKWASDVSTVPYYSTTVTTTVLSSVQILVYTLNYSSHRIALLLRTISLLITKLSTTEIKDNLLRLSRFYLLVGDYRWRGLPNMSTVLSTLADTTGATVHGEHQGKDKKKQRTTVSNVDTFLSKEDAALVFSSHGLNASVIETELITFFISIIVRLGDKQLRPLLQKCLTWCTMNIEDIGPDLTSVGEDIDNDLFMGNEENSNTTLSSSSSSSSSATVQEHTTNSLYWNYASLCRRIVLYRSLEGLITVTRSLFIPYMSMFINTLGQELLASSKITVNTTTNKLISTTVPVSSSSSSAKKRVQFGQSGNSKDNSMDTDDNTNDSEESDDEENDHQNSTVGLSTGTTNLYTLFTFLDYLQWNPTVVHGDGGNVNPHNNLSSNTMTSHTVPHICIPSTPHVLRCLVLGTLLRTLAYDTNTESSFLTQGGDKMTKEKLELFLQPLIQQYELPLSGIKYLGNNGSTVNPSGNDKSKIGTKRNIDSTTVQVTNPSSVQYFNGSMENWDSLQEAFFSMAVVSSSSNDKSRNSILITGIAGGYNGYFLFVNTYLLPCIGSLILALRKDIFWKAVNNKLLLLTRDTNHSRIRLASLQSITELFNRGGDEALVLLPETLPFLSELQHDTSREVQTECHNLLHYLEEASGEDLSEYL